MNFKEMYKSANDDIKADRELIGQIFEKAEKKSFAFPKFTFSYAVVAVVAFAFFFSIYQNFGIAPEEPGKVATTHTETTEIKGTEISELEKAKSKESEKEEPKIVYVGEKVNGKGTEITIPSAAPTEKAEKAVTEDSVITEDETEPVRVASANVLNVNNIAVSRSLSSASGGSAKSSSSDDSMMMEEDYSVAPAGYALTAPELSASPEPDSENRVSVTTSEQGGVASEFLESDDFVKSEINGNKAVITYDGTTYNAYIDAGDKDVTVTVNGDVTEEELEEILNSIK